MCAKKRGTGLDELFSKIFDAPETKDALDSLHSDFGQTETPEEEIIPSPALLKSVQAVPNPHSQNVSPYKKGIFLKSGARDCRFADIK